jgi:hypothetical protein
MRLRVAADIGGGFVTVTESGVSVDAAARDALFYHAMCQTANAHEIQTWYDLTRAELRKHAHKPEYPKPLLIAGELRWRRSELDSYFVG